MDVTNEYQKSNTPALHETILLFGYLRKQLQVYVRSEGCLYSVCAAAYRGLAMANKYDTLCSGALMAQMATRKCLRESTYEILTVSIVLHPRLKTEWFRKQGWTPDRVQDVIDSTKKIWIDKYKTKTTTVS